MADGGENDVDRVADRMGEMISPHAVLGFQVADDRLDRLAALEFAFDRLGDASLLPRDEDPELMRFWRIVAAVAAIGDDAFDRRADLLFHFLITVASVWPS